MAKWEAVWYDKNGNLNKAAVEKVLKYMVVSNNH